MYEDGEQFTEDIEPQNFLDGDVLSHLIKFFSETKDKNIESNKCVEVCF